MLYFAYGSNLLTQRISARCASARVIGPAILEGYQVSFSKCSRVDGSGKATIEPGTGKAQGVLYQMTPADHKALDKIEGVGKGYDRWEGVLVRHKASTIPAVTYIASDPQPNLQPFDWYLALILAGAQQQGLPDVLAAHGATPHIVDPQPERPGRLAALKALGAAGYADWQRFLL